ncbi:hypothetical protein KFL_000200340 [Klebsormidium nitens]|uniref:Uncharacterized protein n=1 Tax=Klebsormidium nitens TaxID=105231 RepID=A0A1Y1HMF9_KLENI|nr:hypothetical protein KFL_000200340 [Klebsormidium nitens]|eukprot:GAQ78882.1 hypothetical protein KFL_000200340 [Klebsormidium nitens]
MPARTKANPGAMDDVSDQVRVLILRQVQLNATMAGEHPPPIPAKLITPLMTRVLAFQLPDVTTGLELLQSYLLDLCEAGSLSIAELIDELMKLPAIFDPVSKAYTAARLFTLTVLRKALTSAEQCAATSPGIWEGLHPPHLAFVLDGLMAVPRFEEFAEYSGDFTGTSMEFSSTTGAVPFKQSQALAALERSLAFLSRRHLVPLVNLVLERLAEKLPAAGSGAFSGMISNAFHSGGASSPKWMLQASFLSAAGMWQFSFLESDKEEATCRLLQAVWDSAIPDAQRSSQRRVLLIALTEIWRTLSQEVHASPRGAAEWKDLLGPEPKSLGALFELQEHFFSTAQKWIRKQKIRNEALSFMQVLLCHGKPEFFKSKHRGFFVTALVAACNDAPSRSGALQVAAAYLEQAPEIFVNQIREVWKAEVLTLSAATFPKRVACPATEFKALTEFLTATARLELKLGVTAIQSILSSPRHHATQKVVALRALKALMAKKSSVKILALDQTLLPTILGCIADKTEPFLAVEAVFCLPPVWPSLPTARSAAPPEVDKASKGQSAPQRVVDSKEEIMEALEEFARSTDRMIAAAAIKALRELAPLLSPFELLRALKIHAYTVTADLQASVEAWTTNLEDVRSILATLKAATQAAPAAERRATNGSPTSPEAPSPVVDPLIPQAQWCQTRLKVEGLSLLGLMHPDKLVWEKARVVLAALNDPKFREMEARAEPAPLSPRPQARMSAPEAVLKSSTESGTEPVDSTRGDSAAVSSDWESRSGSEGAEQAASVPFLADALLVGQPQGLGAEVWERRSGAVGVAWAPELWPFLVQQSERYSFCIEWVWNKVRRHKTEWKAASQDRSKVQGEDASTSRMPSAAPSGVEEASQHSAQLQRNHVYFLCLCMRETQHPELDLDEAAKGRKRQVFQWADVAAKPGLPLMTSKGVTARKAARADDEARAWLNKRRMTRAAVRECLQQVWEHVQGVYEGVAGDETAQLLLCVDAIHASCHEDLILELKRYQTQQRMGAAPLSTTTHHSSNSVNSGNIMRKGSMQLPGSPTKRYDGTFEFQSAATSDFYYQENVLYVLAGLYARTSPEDYRAAPAPVRSALEEFVGAWSREQDLSNFAGLSVKVRMYAVRIIELYLLYTTAAVQAAVAHTGASGADRAEQEAAFVPSLTYRTNMFKCLTVKWSHGLPPAGSAAGSGATAADDTRRKTGAPGGKGSERPSSLDDAVAKAVAALVSMGPLKDRDFENTLLRYLQTYHARGSPGVRAQVAESMAVFLRHNPHRVRSFIAGSFAQLHRVLEKDEAAALALTYFRALARSVESELEEWLTVRGLHPAKILHLCLLHLTSTGEAFRHVALELLATLESNAERPAALLQGVLPAHNDAPPELYIAAAVTTSVHLADAHPEYTVAIMKEALSLQQILPKDVIPTILTLIQPWACNFAAVLREETVAADAAWPQKGHEAEVADEPQLIEIPDARVRALVERMPNLQNLRSSYTEEEEELTSPLPLAPRTSTEVDRRGSVESGRGSVSGGQKQEGSVRKGSTEQPSSPGRKERAGSGSKEESVRKASLESTLTTKRPAAESVSKAEPERKGKEAKVAPEPLETPSSKVKPADDINAVQKSSVGVLMAGWKEAESELQGDAGGQSASSRSIIRRMLDRTFSDISTASSTVSSRASRDEDDADRSLRKRSGTEPEAKPMSPSEQTLLCLFQITRTCGWPPAHSHLLRGVWQGLLLAPQAEKVGVASFVTDFLLLCHMSRAESPETAYVPQGSKKQPGNEAPGRKPAGVGLDQRLAKLLLGYLLETDCGEAVLQRLVDGVRTYTLTTSGLDDGPMSLAWESASQFVPQPVGQKEHSALLLLADAAYHQDTLLVAHLPQLLHVAIVLLRPRAEHLWAHRAAGSFNLCLGSHSLISYLLHSLAVRYAPSNLARERAQTFLDTYYGPEDPNREAGDRADRSKADAQRASADPEERLTTSYLFELISLLQPFRPELRAEWAEQALSWAAGAVDKRIVVDSLRVFAVVNKSAHVGTLAKVERLLLGAVRMRDYVVADSVLDVFAKVVARLCRQDPSRSADSQSVPPSGAWEHVTASALAALSCTNVRMFHKALTMAQVLIEARPEGARDVALDEFWRVVGGPVDETVYELLFPGLLDEKTALGTLSLLETFAKAHAIALPADNKLTVIVLLLNTALIHSGQTQRCAEALRIVDSSGCALADLSAIFTAQMTGKYQKAGPTSFNPAPPPPTSPRKNRTTSYTYGQRDKGLGSPPTSDSASSAKKEPDGTDGTSRTASDANGASEEATRVIRRRPSRHAFLEAFFNGFALAFPSEYTWTFSLHALLALVGRGPSAWRVPLTDVLSSLLHARAHAWTDANFSAVADVIADVPTARPADDGDTKRSQARGDIRALLREHASPAVAQRVLDAIRPLETGKEKPASPDPRTMLNLPPGKRPPGPAATAPNPPGAPGEFLPGYSAGSDAALSRLKRAERWLEYLIAKERRQRDAKRTPLQGGGVSSGGDKPLNERDVEALSRPDQRSSSRSLPQESPGDHSVGSASRRSSAGPEANMAIRADPRRGVAVNSRQNSTDPGNSGGPLLRLAQPTESSARRNSLTADGTMKDAFVDSLRQQDSSRDRPLKNGQAVAQNGGQGPVNGQPVSIKGLLSKSKIGKECALSTQVGTAPLLPSGKTALVSDIQGDSGPVDITVEEWTLGSSGHWQSSTA